jgi:hypothetical protein
MPTRTEWWNSPPLLNAVHAILYWKKRILAGNTSDYAIEKLFHWQTHLEALKETFPKHIPQKGLKKPRKLPLKFERVPKPPKPPKLKKNVLQRTKIEMYEEPLNKIEWLPSPLKWD